MLRNIFWVVLSHPRVIGRDAFPIYDMQLSSPFKILVVDDDEFAADLLAQILVIHGHDALTAYSGSQAMKILQVWRPDFAFLDLQMSPMDGFELARNLRQDEALNNTTIVAYSSCADPSTLQRVRAAKFDLHLTKPAPLEKIFSLLASPRGT